jgi:hypothetical protein
MARAWLTAAVVVMWAGGCAAPPRGEPFEPEVVDPSRAVLYVFRDAQAGLRRRPIRVYINQEPAGTLLPGQYLSRAVPAAEVLVRVEGDASAARPVVLQPGDAAYMQVRTPALGPTRPTLELIESETARRILAGTTRATP